MKTQLLPASTKRRSKSHPSKGPQQELNLLKITKGYEEELGGPVKLEKAGRAFIVEFPAKRISLAKLRKDARISKFEYYSPMVEIASFVKWWKGPHPLSPKVDKMMVVKSISRQLKFYGKKMKENGIGRIVIEADPFSFFEFTLFRGHVSKRTVYKRPIGKGGSFEVFEIHYELLPDNELHWETVRPLHITEH